MSRRFRCAVAAIAAASLVSGTALAQSAQFRKGQASYAENCAACHGPAGRGGSGYANPIWGQGAQLGKYRTAFGLFEYHQLMMPFDDPTRLTDEEKWALTLYLLVNHGVLAADASLDGTSARGVALR